LEASEAPASNERGARENGRRKSFIPDTNQDDNDNDYRTR
jgi:hypothetical protein